VYYVWKNAVYEDYNDKGDYLGKKDVWDIKEHVVETDNVFLWPRVVRDDQKAFGFDRRTLARIEAEYTDRTQFFAQYYNDPNDPGSERISQDKFQYYNPRFLKKEGDRWFYNGRKLNVYAAVDFAFSLNNRADFTAIVVIGLDYDGNIYVLDIDRFKSIKIIDYFQHIRALHSKWNFKKIQAEITAAQKAVVDAIIDYVRKEGLRLKVEEFRPTTREGSKEERIAAVLEHRYENLDVWHNEGGWTQVLEDELVKSRPAHDDIKDALAAAVSIAVKPSRSMSDMVKSLVPQVRTHPRFGGYRT